GEPVAERPPVHPQLTGDLLLADAPFPRLEELDDRHLPAAGDGAHHGPERRGRLPLPVTGVDEDERRCAFGRPGRRCRGRIGGHDPILRGSTAGPSGPSTTLTAPPSCGCRTVSVSTLPIGPSATTSPPDTSTSRSQNRAARVRSWMAVTTVNPPSRRRS